MSNYSVTGAVVGTFAVNRIPTLPLYFKVRHRTREAVVPDLDSGSTRWFRQIAPIYWYPASRTREPEMFYVNNPET